MFKVKMEQVEDLEARALAAFIAEMEAWSAQTFGPRAAAQPPGTIPSEVRRARALGFLLRGHAKRWLALGIATGMPFAAGGAAAAVAGDAAMTPAARLDLLEREAVLVLLDRAAETPETVDAV